MLRDSPDATVPALLLARSRETGSEADAAAAALAASLGGLPLALEQAGAYVAATGTMTLAGYSELYATRALELLKRGQPLDYRHTVATTWSLALQHLREKEPAAIDLLALASFLAPDDLPQSLMTAHVEELPEPLSTVAADPLALADVVAALRRYSLIRVLADGLYVHRLLQTVVRTGLDADAERTWTATAVRIVRAAFPTRSDAIASWPECQRLLPHVLAVAEHGRRRDLESAMWLWLLHQAAIYLWSRGQYTRAQTLQEQALAGRHRLLGGNHPDTFQSMHNLADIRRNLGDLEGARRLYERALTARRRVLGEDHPDTMWSKNNLAVTLRNLGDLHTARQLFEQVLNARRRVLGEDQHDTMWSMNSLAETLRNLGDLHGAQALHEQTLSTRRRVLGDDHPSSLQSMNNLALTLEGLGNLRGACNLHEQALAGRCRILGDHHPKTLTSMNNLAMTRRSLGDLQGAYDLLEKALAGRRRVLGDDHPRTLTSMSNLTAVRNELGELQP